MTKSWWDDDIDNKFDKLMEGEKYPTEDYKELLEKVQRLKQVVHNEETFKKEYEASYAYDTPKKRNSMSATIKGLMLENDVAFMKFASGKLFVIDHIADGKVYTRDFSGNQDVFVIEDLEKEKIEIYSLVKQY